MNRLRGKLTYSNVVATLALFLVLGGGTAYAASHLGKESVGTRQLRNGAVTPAKLSQASTATLTGPKGDTGPVGQRGPQGAPGPQGAAGPQGPAGATKVDVQIGAEANGSFAHCPPGQVAVGGGGTAATDDQPPLFVSEPLTGNQVTGSGGTPDGWFAKVTGGKPAIAFVLCTSP